MEPTPRTEWSGYVVKHTVVRVFRRVDVMQPLRVKHDVLAGSGHREQLVPRARQSERPLFRADEVVSARVANINTHRHDAAVGREHGSQVRLKVLVQSTASTAHVENSHSWGVRTARVTYAGEASSSLALAAPRSQVVFCSELEIGRMPALALAAGWRGHACRQAPMHNLMLKQAAPLLSLADP